MDQLRKTLSQYWDRIQDSLFPWLEETLDPLTETQQQLVTILELVRIEPLSDEIISHNSRDSTAIEARETIKRTPKIEKPAKKKKGRRKKGEEGPRPELTRIERQRTMKLEEMIKDLPNACDKGAKKDSKGNVMYWNGYKLHIDTIDGDIPVSAIVTSASVHDSQVAIPLATMTMNKVVTLYDLMDAAYDVPDIIEHSQTLGHVPLIDKNPRRDLALQEAMKQEAKARHVLKWAPAEVIRYNARSASERVNARLKDEFGACNVRVRGYAKVACHLLFGVLVLAADQLMRLVT
jgi:hypothetical protein